MNTQEIYFDKALSAVLDWFERGMTSPQRVAQIRRWSKMAGYSLDEMIDYAEELRSAMAI